MKPVPPAEDIFDDTQSGLLKQCEANIEEMTQQTRKALAISLVSTISKQAKINKEPISEQAEFWSKFWAGIDDA